jgi:hypothetical protein
MVLSFYHFSSIRLLVPANTPNVFEIPAEGLVPGRGPHGDMWTDLLWLTTDPNPGQGDLGDYLRIKIRLPLNDGQLKRATKLTMDGRACHFLGDHLKAIFSKDQVENMRRCWWVYCDIIPREWCETIDLIDQHPWWQGEPPQFSS